MPAQKSVFGWAKTCMTGNPDLFFLMKVKEKPPFLQLLKG